VRRARRLQVIRNFQLYMVLFVAVGFVYLFWP